MQRIIKKARCIFLLLVLLAAWRSVAEAGDITPNPYDYGNVTIGSQASKTFSTGIYTVERASSNNSNFIVARTSPLTITFKPRTAGTHTATVTLWAEYDEIYQCGTDCVFRFCVPRFCGRTRHTTLYLSLSGTGTTPPPSMSVTPSSYDFGSILPGNSAKKAFTVKNLGPSDLLISSITVTSGASDFTIVSNGCPINEAISPNSSCQFTVEFKPTSLGVRLGTVQIKNNSTTPTQNVSLGGQVENPAPPQNSISISPTSHNYGNVVVGSESDRTFTVTNTGTEPVSIRTIAFSDPLNFYIKDLTSQCQTTVLGPNQSCSFSVTFGPKSSGPKTSTMTISVSLGGETPNPFLVGLAGNGVTVPQDFYVDPSSFDFGNVEVGTLASKSFTLSNYTPHQNVTIQSVSIAGDNSFFVAGNSCGATLKPGQSCAITVGFRPGAQGRLQAQLKIYTSVPSKNPLIVPLAGTGVPPTQDLPPVTSTTYRGMVLCSSLGGTWADTTQQCLIPSDPQTTCIGLGGTWMGTYCKFNMKPMTY